MRFIFNTLNLYYCIRIYDLIYLFKYIKIFFMLVNVDVDQFYKYFSECLPCRQTYSQVYC